MQHLPLGLRKEGGKEDDRAEFEFLRDGVRMEGWIINQMLHKASFNCRMDG